jgi:hypothetical protein
MRIDATRRRVRLGVRELAGPEVSRWDVAWMPGRAQLGRLIHERYRRAQARDGYDCEQTLTT